MRSLLGNGLVDRETGAEMEGLGSAEGQIWQNFTFRSHFFFRSYFGSRSLIGLVLALAQLQPASEPACQGVK